MAINNCSISLLYLRTTSATVECKFIQISG